ncbi:AMP-binding protein, partial [Amycolatopsis sp. NPDC000673]
MFVARLIDNAARFGDRPAIVHCQLTGAERTETAVSYAELDRDARAAAAWLRVRVRAGSRVLLAYPSGVEFLRAFLGCLYAGVLPVPVPLPERHRRNVSRSAAIVIDADVSMVFTDACNRDLVSQWLSDEGLVALAVIASDSLPRGDDAADSSPSAVDADTSAFLQYTSGSTSEPKGVLISHGNLAANLALGADLLDVGAGTTFCSWLPVYHDMGLIAMTLLPLYLGGTTVVCSPADFMKRPVSWLELIAAHRAQVAAAPNFGYELCARRVTDKQAAGLDLSCWQRACNGAEPIDPATLRRFADRFAGNGFRPEALVAGYGMAESTLFVAGSRPGKPPVVTAVDAAALERDELVPATGGPEIVGCGRTADMDLLIVDPHSAQVRPDGRVGEIWLRGPSVAQGYWR